MAKISDLCSRQEEREREKNCGRMLKNKTDLKELGGGGLNRNIRHFLPCSELNCEFFASKATESLGLNLGARVITIRSNVTIKLLSPKALNEETVEPSALILNRISHEMCTLQFYST